MLFLYHVLVEVEVHCHPKKHKLHYMNYGKQNWCVIGWINNRIITSDNKDNNRPFKNDTSKMISQTQIWGKNNGSSDFCVVLNASLQMSVIS